jgi:hypothetical protein
MARFCAEEAMRRIAMVGAVLLIGYGLPVPASADGVPPEVKTTPGCHCPLMHRRAHARVRHHRWAPPPQVAAIGPDLYNVLIPNPWDTAYDPIVVEHFRSPAVTGFYSPEATPPSWHGVLPYRIRTGDAVLQYDGLIGRYVPLAQADAALVAAAVPQPPPPR